MNSKTAFCRGVKGLVSPILVLQTFNEHLSSAPAGKNVTPRDRIRGEDAEVIVVHRLIVALLNQIGSNRDGNSEYWQKQHEATDEPNQHERRSHIILLLRNWRVSERLE
ncbi:hypothetical protein HYZ64_02500 [Candidatus Berkelbacteria bacterium]|nr:hypothetical protein [Candidatus Berkelbacteria bacterium]